MKEAIQELENLYETFNPYIERNQDTSYLEVMAVIKNRIRLLKEINEFNAKQLELFK